MKKVYLLFLVFVFVNTNTSFGQEIKIPDSLQNELTSLNADERFSFFYDLSKDWNEKNAEMALDFSKMAYQESTRNSNEEQKINALIRMVHAYNVLALYDTVAFIAQEIMESSDDISNDLKMEAKMLLARSQYHKALYSESMKNIEEVIPFYKNKGDSVAISEASSLLASVYTSLGDFAHAIENYQRSLKISEELKDTVKLMMQYSKIGSMYMRMENFEVARLYFFKGINISDNFQKSFSYKTLMSHTGSYYNRMHIYDSAEIYYKEGMDASKAIGKKDDIAGTYLNIGNLYCRQQKFGLGKAYLDTALIIFSELDLIVNMAQVYDSYSVMYSARRIQDSSLYYAEKVLKIGRQTKNSRRIKSSLYRMAAAYDKMGDYKNSLKYAKKFMFYNDSITGEETRAKVAELETKYETAKKERDIIKLKAEKKAQKDKELILWISFIAVLVILLLIVWFIIQKRKKDAIINQQEKLVLQKEKALSDSELEKSNLQEQELKKEIQYKSKQLTTHALNMMQKNTLMQEIQDELVVVSKKANNDNKPVLSRIKMLIKKNLRSEKDWDLFKLYFEDVNKQFYKELAEINPDLTSNDLKLCALLKLNMNIKESASVMNIEPASVKTARYKLRKKLNLKPEDDLVEVIRKIG